MDDRESSAATIDPSPTESPADATKDTPGGSKELLKLAGPLIIATSFSTIQFTVDRAFLSQYDPDAMGASMPAMMIFWLGMSLLYGTAGYTATFVAQYTGAKRPERVGPAVWQGIYVSIFVGALFLLLWPFADQLFVGLKHDPDHIPLESAYFRMLLCAAIPLALMEAVIGFFSGRGDTWNVTIINAAGTVVHIGLDYFLIFGRFGFPEMGITGAGLALVLGSWTAAIVGLAMFFRPKFRLEFATLSGWKPDWPLLGRFLKYGVPSGMQWCLDVISFTLFVVLVDRIGKAAANATSMTFTLNSLTFLPMMGLGQAISVLVGKRIGEKRPEIAEKTVYTGLRWGICYMVVMASVFVLAPTQLMWGFRPPDGSPKAAEFADVAAIVPSLLICVALYSLADAVYLIITFALRGAGDTRFVMWVTFALAWPVMILPTWYLVTHGYSIYWPWAFATAYVGVMAICFGWRFRTGKWKSMQVIEAVEKPELD